MSRCVRFELRPASDSNCQRIESRDSKPILKEKKAVNQPIGVYPYLLGAGSVRPNPKQGAPDAETSSCIGFNGAQRGIET